MPAVALDDDELTAVTEYVTGLAGAGDGESTPATTAPAEPPEAGDVGDGEDLFVGREQLAAGGPAWRLPRRGFGGRLRWSGVGSEPDPRERAPRR